MTEPTRRENIVRFVQQSAAVAFAVWLAVVFNRRSQLADLPMPEVLGSITGWLIAALPFGMLLTAGAWGFRSVLGWVLRKP